MQRKGGRGTAHRARTRRIGLTTVRRRRALITVSRTPMGAEDLSGCAQLLEEPVTAPLADEPQGEGDQSGCDRETERERGEANPPAPNAPFGARRRRVQEVRTR